MQGSVEHAAHAAAPVVDGFLPHGYCYLWNTPLLVTHVASDLAIGVSYVAISFALAMLVHRARRDIPFSAVFVAFGLFIVTCGITHFMEVWTLWRPSYWASGYVKVATALASVATALAMPRTVPGVLGTIRDAQAGRERAVAEARAAALAEQNATLQAQASALEVQTREAHALAAALERTNAELQRALRDAQEARGAAEEARRAAEEARHAAEEANRAKSQFLTVMSHELRTPLNAIGGYAELLELGLRGPITDEQRDDLGRIRRSQQHLVGVISDILNYARIEAGALEYRRERFDAAEALRDVAALVAPQAAAKGLTILAADGATAPRTVLADPERTRQVLVNLLSNAVKFTGPGGVIRLAIDGDGRHVRLQVGDTGRGIAAVDLARVFEPFVQLDPALTRTQEGTGLGLAISRDLALGMGGDLAVESTPGVGSTFTLILPAADAP